MKTKPIHIGIIGGMGPQASALLHTLIVQACTDKLGIRNCHEFPLITHISIPAVDFISNPELRHKNHAALKNAVNILEITPVDIAVIACNTAHLLIEEVRELERLPLITLPESVVQKAHKAGVKKLGLLSTSVTAKTKLYRKYADNYNLDLVVPDDFALDKTDHLIRTTIAGQSNKEHTAELREMADDLKERGAELVVLGCTELSVMMHNRHDIDLIDALTATTDAVIDRMCELKE